MFAPTESRAIASALLTFPTDQHQWELRTAAADEDMRLVSDIANLPPELRFAMGLAASLSDTLTASAPGQARAPKGTPIGGQWIETPGGLIDGLAPGRGVTSPSAPPGVQDTVREQGGASIDPLTGLQPTDGYMVAVQGHNEEVPEDEFFGPGGEDRLVAWMDRNQEALSQPGGHIGLWHDTANGEVVFDVSQRVEDLDEAIRLGGERNQQAIWDVAGGVEIPTGGTGDRQASAYRMDDHDRANPRARPAPARRVPPGLGELGRGAQTRVRPSDGRRPPGHWTDTAWAVYDLIGQFASADQVRAPKGTPQGGQWIDTPGGMARQIAGVNRAVRGLGKPTSEPMSYDAMDDDYNTLVSSVNPGYLADPNDPRYNQNCQRVVQAMEMRARGFDAQANMWDGTRDDSIAVEDCWVDPQTGSVRLFSPEVPPSQAMTLLRSYPPGSRFILSGWDEGSQFGHVWNGEVLPDGTFMEVDGQGGSEMFEPIFDTWDQVAYLRVDDLTPTDKMFEPPPIVVAPGEQRGRPLPGIPLRGAAAPTDPVEAGQAAGYDVIESRDLGNQYHLIVANPVHKFSDSLLVLDKGTGWVGYVSRFTHPAVQTSPQEVPDV